MTKREAEELLELSRKATPGPWQRKGLHIYAGTRGQVAQIPRPQNGGVFECTANAELIPELRNCIEPLVQMLQQAAEIIESSARTREAWFPRKICKHCRWWELHGPADNNEGFCLLVETPSSQFRNSHSRESLTGGVFHPAVWAKHDDVRTSPDFGCNQWEEPKP